LYRFLSSPKPFCSAQRPKSKTFAAPCRMCELDQIGFGIESNGMRSRKVPVRVDVTCRACSGMRPSMRPVAISFLRPGGSRQFPQVEAPCHWGCPLSAGDALHECKDRNCRSCASNRPLPATMRKNIFTPMEKLAE
jgi:hypothetical protein